MGSHLLPEGGTEQTSTAPASLGNKVSISRIKPNQHKNKFSGRKCFLKQYNQPRLLQRKTRFLRAHITSLASASDKEDKLLEEQT